MALEASLGTLPKVAEPPQATSERPLARGLLVGIALLFVALFLLMPLLVVFVQAFSSGLDYYLAALSEPDTRAAIRLTLMVAAIAVPLNLVFGLAAAWAIAKFEFKGKAFLITLIDLPFSEPRTVTVRQPDGAENAVAITGDAVCMAHANCENQDCVNMGQVTLDNLETRVMGGFIICLPHRVSVEVRE